MQISLNCSRRKGSSLLFFGQMIINSITRRVKHFLAIDNHCIAIELCDKTREHFWSKWFSNKSKLN